MRGPMKVLGAAMLILALWVPTPGHAATTSYTGTLAASDAVEELVLTVLTPSDLVLQTYGFGGG